MVLIYIIIGLFFSWLFGVIERVLEKNKSLRTKNKILIGILGGILGKIFWNIFSSLDNYYIEIEIIIPSFIGTTLIYYLAIEIRNTKLKAYLDVFNKLSPFIGVISILSTCNLLSTSHSLVSASSGVLLILILIVLFTIFVLWGMIKIFNNNNYFKNNYLFLILYSIPLLLLLE